VRTLMRCRIRALDTARLIRLCSNLMEPLLDIADRPVRYSPQLTELLLTSEVLYPV